MALRIAGRPGTKRVRRLTVAYCRIDVYTLDAPADAATHNAARRVSPTMLVALSVTACVALYAVQVWVTDVTFGRYPERFHSALMILTGALQSALLYAVARVMSRSRTRAIYWAIVLGIASMFVLSIAFSSDTDIDASAYVGYAKLSGWHDAYRPQPAIYHNAGFDIINLNWGRQLPGLVYGPLWLLVDRVVARNETTFAGALLALRLCNVVFLALLLEMLRRLRVTPVVLVLVAFNPALWFYYVVQAHNDLMAIALLVAGMSIAQRRPVLGAVVAGAAGLVKISFVALAVCAHTGRRSLPASLRYFGISVAVVVLISGLFGGVDYLRAMQSMGRHQIAERTDAVHFIGVALHVAVAAIAGAALLLALLFNRFTNRATYTCATISTIIYPWYLGWCLPYALRVPTFTVPFLISLPGLAHFIDPHFSLYAAHSFAVLDLLFGLMIVWAGWSFVRRSQLHRQQA